MRPAALSFSLYICCWLYIHNLEIIIFYIIWLEIYFCIYTTSTISCLMFLGDFKSLYCLLQTFHIEQLTLSWDSALLIFGRVYPKPKTLTIKMLRQILFKVVSPIFYQIFIFHQMISLSKLWKMFFISFKKLFSFSRYLGFCISVFHSFSPCQPLPQGLIKDKS